MADKVPLNMLETPFLTKMIVRGGSLVFQFSNGKAEVVADITKATYDYILEEIKPGIDAGVEDMPRSVINPDDPKDGDFKVEAPTRDGTGTLTGTYLIQVYVNGDWQTLIEHAA